MYSTWKVRALFLGTDLFWKAPCGVRKDCAVVILGRASEGFWGDNPDDPGVVGRRSGYWTLEGHGSGPLTHGFFSIANTTELCGLRLVESTDVEPRLLN